MIIHVAKGETDRRAAMHRAGGAEFSSRVTAGSYRRVMFTCLYWMCTDLAVAPDGRWFASALGWYEEVNRAGLVDPVSCAPPWRSKGLAKAVNIALLHTFRSIGATSAVMLPCGDQRGSQATDAERAAYQARKKEVMAHPNERDDR